MEERESVAVWHPQCSKFRCLECSLSPERAKSSAERGPPREVKMTTNPGGERESRWCENASVHRRGQQEKGEQMRVQAPPKREEILPVAATRVVSGVWPHTREREREFRS